MFVNKPSAKMGILFKKIREKQSEDRVIKTINNAEQLAKNNFYHWYTITQSISSILFLIFVFVNTLFFI